MVRKIVFKNVLLKMNENGMGMCDLADACGMAYPSIRRKLRGEGGITLEECLAVKAALHSELPLETLFERVKENA